MKNPNVKDTTPLAATEAYLGTVRRCGSDILKAYDYDMVMTLLKQHVSDPIEFLNVHFNYEGSPYAFICRSTLAAATEEWTEFLVPDGLETSFIGMTIGSPDRPPVGVFSYDECVKIIMNDMDDSEEDPLAAAIEFIEFNTIGAYVGETTPFFLETGVDELEETD